MSQPRPVHMYNFQADLFMPDYFFNCLWSKAILPANAHISTPFFQKTVFFSKIFFGMPPSKFLEVCLNSDDVMMKSSLQF